MTIFTVIAGGNNTTVMMSNLLKTVADTKKRNILLLNKLPQFFRNVRSILFVNTARTSREDNTLFHYEITKKQYTLRFFFSMTTLASTRQENNSQ